MKLNYTLKREKRRSLTIRITENADVIVKAPHRLPQQQIDQFLEEKSGWISKKLALQQRRSGERPAHRFNEGEKFEYLGETYSLQIIPPSAVTKYGLTLREPLDLHQDFILHAEKQPKAREAFTKWYKSEARTILADRVGHFCDLAGLRHQSIKLSNAKTRWGSCSSKGNLNFNWRIIMAPMEVVDYLVAHEVAHLRHQNHSKSFWNLVGEIYPDYKQHRRWLKENGHRLEI
ncbi:MAG: SprT family zinc-dependent metalloprotease [Candidatus Dojkabacteria bacterium]|nr:MAG: SprT family zinc-dependent metalloprotease [Candidatus Dojkabacteria bacterium]